MVDHLREILCDRRKRLSYIQAFQKCVEKPSDRNNQ